MSNDTENRKQEKHKKPKPPEPVSINPFLRTVTTTLGVLLVTLSLTIIVRHMIDPSSSTPKDLEATFILSIGLVLIILFNIPWTKIKVGEVEVERALQNQAEEYAQDMSSLTEKLHALENIKGSTELTNSVQSVLSDFTVADTNKELILSLLQKWPTWGFTASRIQKWGAIQQGFEKLGTLSLTQIRSASAALLKSGDIRTRLSKNNNVLYQANLSED